jgi:adenylosuccinate synthase
MPYHKILDGLYEEAKGAGATGTTRRGIGPVFADKVSYNGIRWSDFEAKGIRVAIEGTARIEEQDHPRAGGDGIEIRRCTR